MTVDFLHLRTLLVILLLSQDMNNSKLFSDEAANIYERAIGTLLKKNMLLYFAFADYEEVSIQLLNHQKLQQIH